MGTLIVDLHSVDGERRIADLKEVLRSVTNAEPAYAEQVYGQTQSPEPDLENVRTACDAVFRNRRLVLLHCGGTQHCLPDVLDLETLRPIPVLLYSGGVVDDAIDEHARGKTASSQCAPIPEQFRLTGLTQDQKQRLESTIRSILEARRTPNDAVEDAFGDPDLEQILGGLYQRLAPGADMQALETDRNAALEEHYRNRRGW